MNEKEKKVLLGLDILELLISIIGFIVCCLIFALTKFNERYFFYVVAIALGFNIIHSIRKLESKKEKVKVIKYSKKLISAKSIKKVSY